MEKIRITQNASRKTILGFTLIELLVSISIIAILTALLTVNFIGARQRGRDGQRKANVFQMQSALELYRSDNGTYPAALGTCGGSFASSGGTIYMQKIPCDPQAPNPPYIYVAAADGSTYELLACLENAEDSEKSTDPLDAARCTSPTVPFKLTNP